VLLYERKCITKQNYVKRNFALFAEILDSLCFQEHSRRIPGTFFLARRPAMPYFCHQVSYTKEAWAKLVQNPQDRQEAVRGPIEKLGGTLEQVYFAFGPFDVMAITDMPDSVSAAAISMAFAAGGAVQSIQTVPLMTTAEALDALRKAGTCGYKSVTAAASAAAAGS
jgi:uncharacterized protein with GYD domain